MERASLSSVLAGRIIRLFREREISAPGEYEKRALKSRTAYRLPRTARKHYGFSQLGKYTDTFFFKPKSAQEETVFYLHGGSYWADPMLLHYRMLKKLAKRFCMNVVLPVYPKAPAHHADEALQMVYERYLYLIRERGIPPQRITLMGESAGAGLALVLLMHLKRLGTELPRCAVLHSPWVDVSMENEKMKELEKTDPLLSVRTLAVKGKAYAGERSVKDELVSPLFGDLSGLPPLFVDCGTHEILWPDIEKMCEKAKAQGTEVTLRVFPGQIHCFAALPIPEARKMWKLMRQDIFGCAGRSK